MNTKSINIEEADRDQLYFYAKTVLGIDVHHSTGEEKLLARIREVEPDGKVIQVEDTPENQSAPAPAQKSAPAPAPTAASAPENMEEKVRILIPRTEGKDGNRPVFVGVNGKGMLIPRGQPVEVAKKYVEVLRNAVQTKYEHDDKGNVTSYDAEMYPFSLV